LRKRGKGLRLRPATKGMRKKKGEFTGGKLPRARRGRGRTALSRLKEGEIEDVLASKLKRLTGSTPEIPPQIG